MHSGRSGQGEPPHKSFILTPAVQALLIQAVSLALVLAFAFGMAALTQVQLTIAAAALLQGAIAAALSRWRAMASWWLPIQFLFPVALIALHALRLPSWIFLAAFLALVALYWTTFRTQVPFYPSGPATWGAVAALLPAGQARFIDIGSGFGGLVMHLAALRPESSFAGIEVAPLPWLTSMLRARARRSKGKFIRGDYSRLNFAEFDAVFAYLSPAAMPALWRKASTEMRAGALLLSYEFPVPGVEPHIVRQPSEGGPALYGWYI